MGVLSAAELAFWHDNGYVILREAVPPADAAAVVDTIWDFMDMDRDDPATWYSGPENEYGMLELSQAGMVELYQHQSLWTNRQNPRIYGAFVDIWGTDKLWVTIDRVGEDATFRPQPLEAGYWRAGAGQGGDGGGRPGHLA